MKPVTVRQVALRGEPPYDWGETRGVALGLGAAIVRTPTGWFMSEEDAARVEAVLRRDREARAAS